MGIISWKQRKIYFWDSENSDGIGIEADSLISFFACAFGLIVDTESLWICHEEDFELMDEIERSWNQG